MEVAALVVLSWCSWKVIGSAAVVSIEVVAGGGSCTGGTAMVFLTGHRE